MCVRIGNAVGGPEFGCLAEKKYPARSLPPFGVLAFDPMSVSVAALSAIQSKA